jgi:hypothetical protein
MLLSALLSMEACPSCIVRRFSPEHSTVRARCSQPPWTDKDGLERAASPPFPRLRRQSNMGVRRRVSLPWNGGDPVRQFQLATVGGWCAVLVFPVLLAGGALLSSSGAGDLLPGTGDAGRAWLGAVVGDARFAGGAWLLVLMGVLTMVAFVGFYDHLRAAGELIVLAPILGLIGMTLVQVSHLIPIGMAYDLAPAYVGGGPDQRVLGTLSDTMAAICLVTNASGDALVWGVAVPLYAWAILTTRALPRWVGWLGMVVALLAGWLGLFAPASSLVAGISNVGFIAFFVFMLTMGIAILRRRRRTGVDTHE